ncbi:hypothetical protein STEG23_032124, partial [Scotinomys teguina]
MKLSGRFGKKKDDKVGKVEQKGTQKPGNQGEEELEKMKEEKESQFPLRRLTLLI